MLKETDIIAKCLKKDRTAQRQLYDLYKHQWYTVCLRYADQRESANDILQNALIKIFDKIHQFKPELGKFSSWSYKIILNECYSFHRKRVNQRSEIEIKEGADIEASDTTPIEKLSAEELTKIIQMLPDGYRAVFNMYAVEGYTHKEIASKLGIAVGTSKSQYFKAKKILREKVEYLINYRAYEKI